MLDRYTPDCINPVLLRHLRTMHRSGIIWLVVGFAVLAQVLYFYNVRLLTIDPQAAPLSQTASAGVLLVLALLSMLVAGGAVADNVRRERGVDGMDPSLGTALKPGKILAGQALAMVACQAVVALSYVPGIVHGLCHVEATLKLLVCSVGALEASLFILLAAVQASPNGRSSFSPLWLMLAGILIPLLIASFVMCIMTLDAPAEVKKECFLLGQLLADASIVALSCAAIYGANRSRVLDITPPLHRTLLVLWFLWMPLIPLCFGDAMAEAGAAYLEAWGALSIACSAFLFTLVSIEPLQHSRLLLDEARRRSGLRRWLWLPFQGGVVPGYLLAIALVAVTQLVVNWGAWTALPIFCTVMQCYGLFYCAVILWLRKTFRLSPGMAYVVLWLFNMVVQSFSGFFAFSRAAYGNGALAGRALAGVLTGQIFIQVGDNGAISCSPWVAVIPILAIALWYYTALAPFRKQLNEEQGATEAEK